MTGGRERVAVQAELRSSASNFLDHATFLRRVEQELQTRYSHVNGSATGGSPLADAWDRSFQWGGPNGRGGRGRSGPVSRSAGHATSCGAGSTGAARFTTRRATTAPT